MATYYLKRIKKYCCKLDKNMTRKRNDRKKREERKKHGSCTLTDYSLLYLCLHVILSCLCSLTSFCELVNSLLQQSKDTAQDLDHLPEGILEVSLSEAAQSKFCLSKLKITVAGLK